MRILHVVTLVSPDGAFGGPVRVAENLARELRRRGHDVTVAAAASGFADGEAPTQLGASRRAASAGSPPRDCRPGSAITHPGSTSPTCTWRATW